MRIQSRSLQKKAHTTRAVLPLLEELKGKIDVFIMLPDVTGDKS